LVKEGEIKQVEVKLGFIILKEKTLQGGEKGGTSTSGEAGIGPQGLNEIIELISVL
jgi:hypothetical protein